jgi:hypothetical protein
MCFSTTSACWWLSNKSFPDKKGLATDPNRSYAKSKLFSEHALVHYEDWNRDAVMDRRKVLMDWTMTRWHVPDIGIAPSIVGDVADDDEDEEEDDD